MTYQKINVSMKFGGSSLANSDRIEYVANLIKGQIAAGYRPRAVVCSAMGKTTNSLLAAGDFALDGRVNVDAIRTLHLNTCEVFNFPNNTREEVTKLLEEVSESSLLSSLLVCHVSHILSLKASSIAFYYT